MLTGNSAISIERILLEESEITRLESKYNLVYEPLSQKTITELDDMSERMLFTREQLYSSEGVEIPESKATLYLPDLVLSKPLSGVQIKAINTDETEAVAEFSTSVQQQLLAVPIQDNYEDMQYLPSHIANSGVTATFSKKPFHEACGSWSGRERQFWVRISFADRLVLMGKLLNAAGVQLHFEDAFRPMGVQEGLFMRRVAWTRRDYPEWNEDRIIDEAKSKTAAIARLASHKGGAAVDATIKTFSGQPLSFGHEYPDGGALVFPKTPFVTAEQWKNRQLYQVAAGLSGLTLYVGEDWHVSYGDNLASLNTAGHIDPLYTAKYGPIKGFYQRGERGVITEVYSEDEMNQVFSTGDL